MILRNMDTKEVFEQVARMTEWELLNRANKMQMEPTETAEEELRTVNAEIQAYTANPAAQPNFDLAVAQRRARRLGRTIRREAANHATARVAMIQRRIESRVLNLRNLRGRQVLRAIDKQQLFDGQGLVKRAILRRDAVASVFRALRPDPVRNRGNVQVALKIGRIRNVSKEKQLLSKLRAFQHPNIIQSLVNPAGYPRGREYMGFDLEWTTYDDLETYLNDAGRCKSGPIAEERVWDIAIQLFRGLVFLHTGKLDVRAPPPAWVPIVHQNIKLKNIMVTLDTGAPNMIRLMISGFDLAEYYTGPHPAGSPLAVRPGVGDPDHTVAPEYPLSSPALDVWCAGQAIHRLVTGSSARIKHRWLNEERRSPAAVGYANQFLAMNLQPMNVQNLFLNPANRDRTKPDRPGRHAERIAYSPALAWNLYHMLGYIGHRWPGYPTVIYPLAFRRTAPQILADLEADWDVIAPNGAVPANVHNAALFAPALAGRHAEAADMAREHDRVRDGALVECRVVGRAAYVAAFEAASPAGETLRGAAPRARLVGPALARGEVRAAAAAATDGGGRARELRRRLRGRFAGMAPEDVLEAIRSGGERPREKLEMVEWLRRMYNLDDRSWREFERRYAS